MLKFKLIFNKNSLQFNFIDLKWNISKIQNTMK